MSALPPKADMFSVEIDVCFVPKADIVSREPSADWCDEFKTSGLLRSVYPDAWERRYSSNGAFINRSTADIVL